MKIKKMDKQEKEHKKDFIKWALLNGYFTDIPNESLWENEKGELISNKELEIIFIKNYLNMSFDQALWESREWYKKVLWFLFRIKWC